MSATWRLAVRLATQQIDLPAIQSRTRPGLFFLYCMYNGTPNLLVTDLLFTLYFKSVEERGRNFGAVACSLTTLRPMTKAREGKDSCLR